MELIKHPTLADSICDVRSRKIKQTFFTQINTLLDWNPIKLYPNPVNHTLYFATDKNIAEIKLFNLIGKKVMQVNNAKQLNTQQLESGIYIAKILLDGKTITKKIIKI